MPTVLSPLMRLAFYRSSAPGATALDRWTDRFSGSGGFSHVELAFASSAGGMPWCFSSSPRDGGCRWKQIDVSDRSTWETVIVPRLGAIEECRVRRFCQSQDGKRYDWLGVVNFVLPLRLPDHPGRRWFCSEICTYALHEGGQLLELKPQSVSPNSLYRYVSGL